MQTRYQRLVLQHQGGFDQARDAARGMQMPRCFGFTEPMAQEFATRQSRKASCSAAISIGSPNGVPVPWVSM